MRKTLKISYRVVTIAMLLLVVVGMLVNRTTEENSGGYTAVTSPVTAADRKWVHETFGQYETFEELLYDGMIPFAIEHFVYDDNFNHCYLAQNFTLLQFRADNYHGVCYQFAQWAKSIVVELYGDKIQTFVVDVHIEHDYQKNHSYNYFVLDGETYFVDLTTIVSRSNRNLPYGDYAKAIGNMSLYDYSEEVLNDKIYRVY